MPGSLHPVSYFVSTSPCPNTKLLIHGGAWDIPLDLRASHRRGLENSFQAAVRALDQNLSSLDVVCHVLEALENDPTFDAGVGSFLNEVGDVELDAAVMVGKTLAAGAVAGICGVKNPSQVARCVMEKTDHVLLVGTGAEKFAKEQGFEIFDSKMLVLPREWEAHKRWISAGRPDAKTFFAASQSGSQAGEHPDKRGTVGVVLARKEPGSSTYELFAGTSTGGIPGKMVGRVGDAPLIACGTYADDEGAAVSCTGWGEGFIRLGVAKAVSEMVRAGKHPQEAAEQVLSDLYRRTEGRGGIIAIDALGRCGAAFSTPDMACVGEILPQGLLQ